MNYATFLLDAAPHNGVGQVKGQKQSHPGVSAPSTNTSILCMFLEACVTVVVAAMTAVSGIVCWVLREWWGVTRKGGDEVALGGDEAAKRWQLQNTWTLRPLCPVRAVFLSCLAQWLYPCPTTLQFFYRLHNSRCQHH